MTIEEILTAKEGENFEFKTAENRFSYTELQKYACAISNEGGGKIVFGVTDKQHDGFYALNPLSRSAT